VGVRPLAGTPVASVGPKATTIIVQLPVACREHRLVCRLRHVFSREPSRRIDRRASRRCAMRPQKRLPRRRPLRHRRHARHLQDPRDRRPAHATPHVLHGLSIPEYSMCWLIRPCAPQQLKGAMR